MSCFLLMFLWLLGAAILGFLLAWLLRKSSVDTAIKEKDHQYGLYQSLDGKYQTATSEAARLEEENSHFQNQRMKLSQQISELENDRSAKAAELSESGNRYTDLETRFSELNTTYGTAKSSLDDRTTAFDELQVAYDKLAAESADKEARFERLKRSISGEQEIAKAATKKSNSLKADFDRVFEEKQRFSTQLEHFRSTQSAKEEKWKTNQNELEHQVQELSNKLETTDTEKQQLTSDWQSKYTALEAEKAELATIVSTKEEQRGNWEKSFNEMYTTNKDLTTKIAQFEAKGEGLNAEKQVLNDEVSQLKEQLEAAKTDSQNRVAELERLLAQNTESVTSLNNEKTQLTTQLADLKSSKAILVEEKEELNTRLNQLSTSKDGKVKELETQLDTFRSKASNLEQEKAELNTRLNQLSTSKDARVSELETQVNNLKAKTAELEQSRMAFGQERSNLETQINQLSASNTGDAEQLRTENKTLLAELADFRAAVAKRQSSSADNDRKRQETLARIQKLNNKVDVRRIGNGSAQDKDNLKRLRGLGGFVEQKFNALGIYKFSQIANFMEEDVVQMNKWLELPKNKIQKEDWVLEARRILGLEVDTDPVATLERVQGRQKSINFGRIGTASAANKDDLQRINDISAFDEAKLNALGIYRFNQIGAFSSKDTLMVNESIEVFEGRIDREQWVQQAQQLQASSMEETLARVKERASSINFSRIGTAVSSAKDNLQAINGIGPFIEAKLNAVGIYKFSQIAKFSGEDEATVNEVIELTTGHIQSDEWVRQAKGRS